MLVYCSNASYRSIVGNMDIILIFFLIMLTIGFFVFVLRRYFFLKQRLDRIVSVYTSSIITVDQTESTQQEKLKRHYFLKAVQLLRRLRILTQDSARTYSAKLAHAGWLTKDALVVFTCIQILLVLISLVTSIVFVIALPWLAAKSFSFKGIIVIGMVWIGYRLPDLYLKKAIPRYRRKLSRSFLDFLDLFLICIEAGFSNDKALARVSKELKQLHPQFMEQVSLLITELQILPHRRAAWDNFAERTGIEETRVIAQIINQSEQLGSSIGQTLRVQADMFRGEKLSLVEQKAMRLPTLLTLPLVVFLLPALLLIVLGPSLLSVTQLFKGMNV